MELSGLREESYDAIMNVESTAACANPAFINEMLRLHFDTVELILTLKAWY